MVQLRQATARLRFLLADIRSREDELDIMVRQFRSQLERLPRQATHGRTTIDMTLSAMGEVQEQLDHAQEVRQHLLSIKQKMADELLALELTLQVEEAKEALQDLKARASSSAEADKDVAADMRRLEEFIAEYSKRAERAITSGLQEGKA